MPTLGPTEAVNTCENALRELMANAFQAKWGDGWLDKISTDKQRASWAEKADLQEKRKARRGVVAVPPAGLAYSYLYELLAFADKNWEPLAEALGKKNEIMPVLDRFEQLRDLAAHGHSLRVFEQEFLSGVAGLIRNKVTIYMSSRDPADNYYPRIEVVSDEFGNEARVTVAMEVGGVSNTMLDLKVGQEITFTCTGTDPQDRRLTWRLLVAGHTVVEAHAASGEVVELTWTVEGRHVREHQNVNIQLTSSGEYHRYGYHDHSVAFTYNVRP